MKWIDQSLSGKCWQRDFLNTVLQKNVECLGVLFMLGLKAGGYLLSQISSSCKQCTSIIWTKLKVGFMKNNTTFSKVLSYSDWSSVRKVLIHLKFREHTLSGVAYCCIVVFSIFLLSSEGFAQEQPLVNLSIIAKIESSNNPHAIGDSGNSFGLYQISRQVLSDYNKANRTNVSTSMLRDTRISHAVASWYVERRIPAMVVALNRVRGSNKALDTKNVIVAYNCGVGCLWRASLPKTTKDYLKKYYKLKKELNHV